MRLLPFALASLPALASPAVAQSAPDINWLNLTDGQAELVVGPAFLSTLSGGPVTSASVRHCYSIDRSQGGRSEDGTTEVTWFRVTQAWGGANTVPGLDIGMVSVGSQVSDSLADDACFSPFIGTTGNLYTSTAATIVPGLISATTAGSLNQGFTWTVAFQFLGSVGVQNRLGVDPVASSGSQTTPLLAHMIFEVQAPMNYGTTNKQYWMFSNNETTSTTPGAPGGVTNGNSQFGTALFGAPPEVTGMVNHTRLTFASSGALFGTALQPGSEFISGIAIDQPVLQGVKDGGVGAGGADWRVASEPISKVDLRLMDRLSGAESNPSSSAFNPGLTLNSALAMISCTPAQTMLQTPFSWDDQTGTPMPGTSTAPPIDTVRAGLQQLHVNIDACTLAFLGADFGLFEPFKIADVGFNDVFDYGDKVRTHGGTTLQGGPFKVVSAPIPGLSGTRIGIHAVLLQQDSASAALIQTPETSSALTVVLH
ncbi:hypothetical protein [Engelhardtia mirabilis]|uniref:Uncharacterized protein n=1 Tax=Engelhardtia mirabilis TaxID=2528011 RepID=A0A518BK11_9BACT|nr:hypothetical protein Pla133_23910 [Planctomycetes bacterium Pla133]QDV01637.1 hypothetical protein Pla86_23900 [Planctomycetes bacterium Pla86]